MESQLGEERVSYSQGPLIGSGLDTQKMHPQKSLTSKYINDLKSSKPPFIYSFKSSLHHPIAP